MHYNTHFCNTFHCKCTIHLRKFRIRTAPDVPVDRYVVNRQQLQLITDGELQMPGLKKSGGHGRRIQRAGSRRSPTGP
jgi:hypothetical protein